MKESPQDMKLDEMLRSSKFAAGGFLYIAATDLVPEIRKELDIKKSMATIGVFIFGIIMMWAFKIVFEG